MQSNSPVAQVTAKRTPQRFLDLGTQLLLQLHSAARGLDNGLKAVGQSLRKP